MPVERVSPPRTLFDKIFAAHLVRADSVDAPAILYVDLHLVHEVTSPQAFAELAARGVKTRCPERTLATIDHSTPTHPPDAAGKRPYVSAAAEAQVAALLRNCADHGIEVLGWDSPDRGIVHVIAPELGLTLPGSVIVCGDSHTATHGAFGALAFGIGTSEVAMVLATQCLLQRRSKTMRVTINGHRDAFVAAKDIALYILSILGFSGGTGHVIEYAGDVVRAMTMEERMTLCNMSIEAGARAGLVAPDETTIAALRDCPRIPGGAEFAALAAQWLALRSDADAIFDREIRIDISGLSPMASWGATPDAAGPVAAFIPEPRDAHESRGFDYMGVAAGQANEGRKVDVVFIGSCTNGRLSDLAAAAAIMRGRRVASGVRVIVAPGSVAVKRRAEALGLDAVFRAAGAQWREPGCSMCIAMNGDEAAPGEVVVSTSNRNFAGRQGPGSRTILASPATAAASAIMGALTDPRRFAEAPSAESAVLSV